MKGTLADQVFNQLEQDILNGVCSPGDMLTEMALCGRFQVSRTPVREAIRRLEQSGLVTIQANRSAVVTGVSVQDMLDIYEIRMRIEGLAARWSAINITKSQISALEQILDLQEFYTERKEISELNSLDTAFHKALYADCGSQILNEILCELHLKQQRFRRSSLSDEDRAACMLDEHRAIYSALVRRDGDAAEQLTILHIRRAQQHLAEMYAKQKENP